MSQHFLLANLGIYVDDILLFLKDAESHDTRAAATILHPKILLE